MRMRWRTTVSLCRRVEVGNRSCLPPLPPPPAAGDPVAGVLFAWANVHGFVELVNNGLILLDEAPIAAADRILEQQRGAFTGA